METNLPERFNEKKANFNPSWLIKIDSGFPTLPNFLLEIVNLSSVKLYAESVPSKLSIKTVDRVSSIIMVFAISIGGDSLTNSLAYAFKCAEKPKTNKNIAKEITKGDFYNSFF